MDLTLKDLQDISYKKGFNIELLEKDYLLTHLLYLIQDIKGIYFKGGTALNKIFLNHTRLSEDLDFTLTGKLFVVEKEIKKKLKGTMFDKITHDKRVEKFTRLIVHYKLFHDGGTIFIDLNERARLLHKPERHNVPHFYEGHIPSFSVKTLGKSEMMAEKMAATIGRNRPRDHFDLYMIIKKKYPLDLPIVKKKCESSGYDFDIIKMFNKAKKLKNRWDQDMGQFLKEEISFQTVMKFLAEHFKLKREKEKQKRNG